MNIKPFNFDVLQDFSSPKEANENITIIQDTPEEKMVVEEAPVPTFFEEDLEKARLQAYEKGKAEGLADGLAQNDEAKQEFDKKLDETLASLEGAVKALSQTHNDYVSQINPEVIDFIIRSVEKISGDLIAKYPIEPIENMVKNCLEIIINKPKVNITIAAELEEEVRKRMVDIISVFEGELTIIGSEDVEKGESIIEWNNGKAERNNKELLEKVKAVIETVEF